MPEHHDIEEARRRYREMAEKDARAAQPKLWFSGARPKFSQDWTPGWKAGQGDVTNATAIARGDKAEMGWVCSIGGKVIEEQWTLKMGNSEPERPDSYSHPDTWPDKWPSGDPKNPWTYKIRMPMELAGSNGKTVWLTSENDALRLIIGELEVAYAKDWRCPKVKLLVGKHESNPDNFANPIVKIIGFVDVTEDENAAGKPPANGSAGDAVDRADTAAGRPASRAVDDEIPFSPEWRL